MKPEKMLRTILKWMLALLIILFFVVWLVGGGIAQVTGKAASINAFFSSFAHRSDSSTGSAGGLWGLFSSPDNANVYFKLPWQPDLPQGPSMDQWVADNAAAGEPVAATPGSPVRAEKDFGNPSPLNGSARISQVWNTGDLSEYAIIHADQETDITGWSVQEITTGRRSYITSAAPDFKMGVVNTVDRVILADGGDAILSSGVSPTGVSFRENVCTGYLEEHQTFVPSLTPASFPGAESYTDCAQKARNTGNYFLNTWRIFLGEASHVWSEHGTARLLDADGRIVDAFSY